MNNKKIIQRFAYFCLLVLSLAFSDNALAQQKIKVAAFRPGPEVEGRQYRLPDGDVIMLTVQRMLNNTSPNPNYAVNDFLLKLEADLNVTWWKGINFISKSAGDKKISIFVEDNYKSSHMWIPWIDFASGGYLEFAKAKALGAHTPVYRLDFSSTDMRNWKGKIVTFTWQKD